MREAKERGRGKEKLAKEKNTVKQRNKGVNKSIHMKAVSAERAKLPNVQFLRFM